MSFVTKLAGGILVSVAYKLCASLWWGRACRKYPECYTTLHPFAADWLRKREECVERRRIEYCDECTQWPCEFLKRPVLVPVNLKEFREFMKKHEKWVNLWKQKNPNHHRNPLSSIREKVNHQRLEKEKFIRITLHTSKENIKLL